MDAGSSLDECEHEREERKAADVPEKESEKNAGFGKEQERSGMFRFFVWGLICFGILASLFLGKNLFSELGAPSLILLILLILSVLPGGRRKS